MLSELRAANEALREERNRQDHSLAALRGEIVALQQELHPPRRSAGVQASVEVEAGFPTPRAAAKVGVALAALPRAPARWLRVIRALVDRAEELASRRAGLEDLAQASAALAKLNGRDRLAAEPWVLDDFAQHTIDGDDDDTWWTPDASAGVFAVHPTPDAALDYLAFLRRPLTDDVLLGLAWNVSEDALLASLRTDRGRPDLEAEARLADQELVVAGLEEEVQAKLKDRVRMIRAQAAAEEKLRRLKVIIPRLSAARAVQLRGGADKWAETTEALCQELDNLLARPRLNASASGGRLVSAPSSPTLSPAAGSPIRTRPQRAAPPRFGSAAASEPRFDTDALTRVQPTLTLLARQRHRTRADAQIEKNGGMYGQGARRNHVTARENYAWRNAYHGIRGGND